MTIYNPEQKTILYVGALRRDGKRLVTYAFPISGVRLTKLRTEAQLEAARVDEGVIMIEEAP